MTTTTQKDEDLIILSDESSAVDTSLIDFNFDVSEAQTIEEPIISLSDAEPVLELNTTSSDTPFSFDLSAENTTVSQLVEDDVFAPATGASQDTTAPELNLSLETMEVTPSVDLFAETSTDSFLDISTPAVDMEVSVPEKTGVSLDTLETPVVSSALSRNDILDDAIAKMKSRKDVISQTKTQKQEKVDELNEQIKKLKQQVGDFETEIKTLQSEDAAIDSDISAIEKMKMASLESSQERQRKPNLENIKRK